MQTQSAVGLMKFEDLLMSDIQHNTISEQIFGVTVFAPHSRSFTGAPRKRPSDRQSYRRDSILAATRALFGECGAPNLTVRKIAERSGTTPPTIYNLIGGIDNVLEAALSQSLAECIHVAPHVAEMREINPILALADIFWMASKTQPHYSRNQINLNIKNIEGRRISKMFVENTVNAICSWIPALCDHGGMSKNITASVIGGAIESQFRMAAVDWANDDTGLVMYRRRLAAGAVTNLLYFSCPAEVERMNRWLDFLQAPASTWARYDTNFLRSMSVK